MRQQVYARDIFPTVFNPDHRAWTLSGFAAQRMTGARHLYAKVIGLSDDDLAEARRLLACEFVSNFTSLYGAIDTATIDDWAASLSGVSAVERLLDVFGTEGIVPLNPQLATLRKDLECFNLGWQAARKRFEP